MTNGLRSYLRRHVWIICTNFHRNPFLNKRVIKILLKFEVFEQDDVIILFMVETIHSVGFSMCVSMIRITVPNLVEICFSIGETKAIFIFRSHVTSDFNRKRAWLLFAQTYLEYMYQFLSSSVHV